MLGRRPLIVLDQHRHFRLNQPPDDWPDPLVLPTRPAVPDAAALVARVRATGKSEDSEAFEIAVCDAFAALGFIATHIGGRGAPDGTLDAPLGPLAYRAMLECKTWSGAHRPPHDIAEAAKYRDDFKADFCLIVAPMISEYETEIVSELATHKVSAWTIDDVALLLDAAVDPYELRSAFARKGVLTLLKACPPCQGYSSLNRSGTDDVRNDLVREVMRFVNAFELRRKIDLSTGKQPCYLDRKR